MIPSVVVPDTPSSERRVFESLKNASGSSDWSVLHSLGFSSAWTGEFGEIDFVVIIPAVGIICIEVKGGEVSHKDGEWSTRRHGSAKVEILKRSPFRQAQEGMWKLKQVLDAKFGAGSLEARCPIGWIVVLPAVDCPPITTEFGRDEVIDRSDLGRDIGDRIRGTPSIAQLASRRDLVSPSGATCKRLLGFLRPNFDRVAMASTDVWDMERRIRELTEEQYGVLDAIADNPVCLIKGPAGTGKTNIALECAKRFSAKGKRVLFACYNRPLGAFLYAWTEHFPGVVAGHIHGLLRERIARTSLASDLPSTSTTDNNDLFGRLYFELGALAIDEIGERFDVVLIDEAQDFDPRRLADVVNSWVQGVAEPRIILFGDFARQALYGRALKQQDLCTAMHGAPVFSLSVNCRNTKRIAMQTDLMCGFTGTKTSDKQPEGDPVEVFFTDDDVTVVSRLGQIITSLRTAGYKPSDVVILGPWRRENSLLARTGLLGGWHLEDMDFAESNDIAYSTIHSFKGLERAVVIVIEVGTTNAAETDSLLYVAMTRARVRLFVICNEAARAAIDYRITEGITAMTGEQ
jgi:Nuclease-related domain/UvrD-like helicase C-terminal domain/AAA domain